MTPESQLADALQNAVYFTVFEFRGRDDRRREEHPDLDSARGSAKGRARAMIYAVTPQGFSVHVENGAAAVCARAVCAPPSAGLA